MTLAIGDHVVIKRGDHIVTLEEEAYHEYEVVAGIDDAGNELKYVPYNEDPNSPYDAKRVSPVKLRVVK